MKTEITKEDLIKFKNALVKKSVFIPAHMFRKDLNSEPVPVFGYHEIVAVLHDVFDVKDGDAAQTGHDNYFADAVYTLLKPTDLWVFKIKCDQKVISLEQNGGEGYYMTYGLAEDNGSRLSIPFTGLPYPPFKYIGEVTREGLSFDATPFVDSWVVKRDNIVVPIREPSAGYGYAFKDYEKRKDFLTAKDSFYSLLRANKIWFDNPYGEEPRMIDYSESHAGGSHDIVSHDYDIEWERWAKAEERVVEKENKIIVIKSGPVIKINN